MLALMSKTRWSSFSALPHLFFSVPTPFQSFIFHLHLLGNLIYSTLPQVPSVMKVCEQKHRTESRCLGVVQDKMELLKVALQPRLMYSATVAWALSSFQNTCCHCGRDATSDHRGSELKHPIWVSCSCLHAIWGTPSFRTAELQWKEADCFICKGPSSEYLLIYVLLLHLPLNLLFTSEVLHPSSFSIAMKTMTLHHFSNINPS